LTNENIQRIPAHFNPAGEGPQPRQHLAAFAPQLELPVSDTNPHAPNAHKDLIDPVERRRRQAAFARPPSDILVKIFAMQPFSGVRRVERDQRAVVESQIESTRARGLDPDAYKRGVPDAGVLLFEKEPLVVSAGLIDQLRGEGYVAVDVHWFQQQGKGPVTVVSFHRPSEGEVVEAAEIPAPLQEALEALRWNNATVWLNPVSSRSDGVWTGRKDTINLAKGIRTTEPGRRLMKDGNSYRLVHPAE
jgi:hypothetical protein